MVSIQTFILDRSVSRFDSSSSRCGSGRALANRRLQLNQNTVLTEITKQPQNVLKFNLTVLVDIYDLKDERTFNFYKEKFKINTQGSRRKVIDQKIIPRTVVRFQLIGERNESTGWVTKFEDNLFFVNNMDQIKFSINLVFEL
jgi:hypothetical protein